MKRALFLTLLIVPSMLVMGSSHKGLRVRGDRDDVETALLQTTEQIASAEVNPPQPEGLGSDQPSSSVHFHRGNSALGIPFELVGKHVVVQVVVNDSFKIDMILDTGMGLVKGAILLDPEDGRRLGLEYVGHLPLGGGGSEEPKTANVSVGATLSLQGVTFKDQQLLVLTETGRYEDWPAQGIIGRTVFDCVVEIDYDDSVLNLYEDAAFRSDNSGEALSLTYTFGIPVVDGSVLIEGEEDVPLKLVVDTGAEELLLFPYTNERIKPPRNVIRGEDGILSEGLLGDILGVTGRILELKVGSFVLDSVVTSFPVEESMGPAVQLGQHGFIGSDVLQRFTVVFDYAADRIYLEPNRWFDEPFEVNMAGLLYAPRPNGYLKVYEVVQESPASENGITKGDLIVAINGEDVRELSSSQQYEIFIQEGSTIELTIERDSQRFTRSMTLRRLI